MAQLTPKNRRHSESTRSICYDSAYNNRVFDQCQNGYQSSWVHETWTDPIIHKVIIDYFQEKKITFGAWMQTYVDKKRRSAWDASNLGGQGNNVFARLQQRFGWHLLENI